MEVELRFTDKEITPWGGMSLMKRMLDRMGFDAALGQCGLPLPRSNRGYPPRQLIKQFMVGVWCGANRFEHGEVTRHDAGSPRLFGWKKTANFKAVMRLFRKFDQPLNDAVFGRWFAWLFSNLKIDRLTLDLDSTVMTRHGKQEGAARGYNPGKRGRPSHHPLIAFLADVQMVANLWLRPGNTRSANNASAFLGDTIDRLGAKRIGLLRADSGFSEAKLLEEIEGKHGLSYIIALRLNQPLQRALVRATGWWPVAPGIEIASFDYPGAAWRAPRRGVAIRQPIEERENAPGKTRSLFANDPQLGKYRYAALVTNLTRSALEIWRTGRGRADGENRIQALKYDFAADSFCLNDCFATEACLNVVMMAFNLMSRFRQTLLKSASPKTLKTLRYQLFEVAGYLTREGRKPILKLALAMKRRVWFTGLWEQSATFTLPVTFSSVFGSASPG